MIYQTILAVEEVAQEGGLFDIDATLPLMAIQFLLLALILNAIFYKPLGKAIDERNEFIRNNQLQSKERLTKVEKLAQQYEEELAGARRAAQKVIGDAQKEAQITASEKVAAAQQEAQGQREKASQEIEQQKQEAYASLEKEVDGLSRQILEKLLGADLAAQR